MIDLQQYWWPLAISNELNNKQPLARTLLGVPVDLFRNAADSPAILQDRCPHRHAPLSRGRVCNGEVECPYHGWRFNTTGGCSRLPGLEETLGRKPLIRSFAACEEYGLVWGCLSINEATPAPVPPAEIGSHIDSFFMVDSVNCSIAEAAENFLDGFHTHFVHSGWIRRDTKRQKVKAQVRNIKDGVEAIYRGESLQSGLISRLLESNRAESMGRFRLPAVAEIEYQGKNGLNLLITAWLTPEAGDTLRIHARIATLKGLIPSWVKKAILKKIFSVILNQDKTILELTHANILKFKSSPQGDFRAEYLDSDLDLLGPSIRSLLEGNKLRDFDKHITLSL